MIRGRKVLIGLIAIVAVLGFGIYLISLSKPMGVAALESQIGPLVFRGSPTEMEFTENYIKIQWYADRRFLGEPQVGFKFYASRNTSDLRADSEQRRIKGTHEEFLFSKYFMGHNLVPVRAPYITMYFSSEGSPSEDEIKKILLENIKIKPASAEEFFNSPEIQSVLAKSRSEKEEFLNIMKARYGLENPRLGNMVSKPIGDWAVVQLENSNDYIYKLTFNFSLAPGQEFKPISDYLFDHKLVTVTGPNESAQFKEKYPFQAGEFFVFRGTSANLSRAKILKPGFEAQLKEAISQK